MKKHSIPALLLGICVFLAVGLSAETISKDDLLEIVRNRKWEDLPQTIVSPKDGAEMILIPAGEFTMGIPSDSSMAEEFPDAVPEHKVYLDALYIDKYEITNEKYNRFVEDKVAKSPLFSTDSNYNHPNQPVVGIRYGDAVSYSLWAGKRLPTEAEWEKAARGTDGRLYPWGSTFSSSKCNAYPSQIMEPVNVGQYPDGKSPYGAMDVAGNIAEWVFDVYSRSYYKESPYKNPRGPSSQINTRVIRGGDYKSDPKYVSSVVRFPTGAYSAYPNIGFRCVVSVADLETIFDPQIAARNQQEAIASGVTVISDETGPANIISEPSDFSFFNSRNKTDFQQVGYYKSLDFDGYRCVGKDEIRKSERIGSLYWKVYYDSPGKITQAQFYDKRDKLQFYVEPVYDDQVREKQIKLYDQKGRLVFRSERFFKEGTTVKGILYSATGDYIGEEKF